MSIRRIVAYLPVACIALGLAGCGSEAPGTAAGEFNVNPTSHAEAAESLGRIRAALEANPQDASALQASAQIQTRLDELNHLVARLEPKPGYTIDFYEPMPGLMGVMEHCPSEAEALLTDAELHTPPLELYQRFANGAPAPAALLRAVARSGGGAQPNTSRNQRGQVAGGAQAGGGSEDTGVHVLDAFACYSGDDYDGCRPSWTDGGWAQANAKTTGFRFQWGSGAPVIRYSWNGTDLMDQEVLGGFWHWHYQNGTYSTCSSGSACDSYDYYIDTMRWDILDASGDSFGWSVRFDWNCIAPGAGSPWCPTEL